MGYPVYKLLRAVNRQYPNNGFINYVDVTEEMTDGLIDEDLRDLINETLQETYINIALDEVYSFPTVPGQKEYVLPEDCDLRDIQEVTRTFATRGPMPPPPADPSPSTYTVTFYANGGTGDMEKIVAEFGEEITVPACTITAPVGYEFSHYDIDGTAYAPGDTYTVTHDATATVVWEVGIYTITFRAPSTDFVFADGYTNYISFTATGGLSISASVPSIPKVRCVAATNTFTGWQKGATLMSESQILNTVVSGDMEFVAQSANVGSWNVIFDDLANATLVIKYKLIGTAEATTTISTGTSSFAIAKGDALLSRYEYIDVYEQWTDESSNIQQTLIYSTDVSEVLIQDKTVPIIDYDVTFSIDTDKGTFGVSGTLTKQVTENSVVMSKFTNTELNNVTPEEDYLFRGWSRDGVNVIPLSTIMNTKIIADTTYLGVFVNRAEPVDPGHDPEPA